jgi:hypothetical protein
MNLLTKLKFWADNKYNVILEGYHGTGKTESVKDVFTKKYGVQGVDWLYFSAATMDAWVDFVGVPREVVDEDGSRYLDLIRPRAIAKNTVKAIFFDEFNRAPAKTRNAVMELLQFKSINGKSLDNLEIIWAAINPDEDDMYDVERLDPAQKDRFHVHVKVPYDVVPDYFFEKYGKIGENACEWWRNKLSLEQRRLISPRRLDTAVQMFLDGGEVSDVIPVEEHINPAELVVLLEDGSYIRKLNHFMMAKDYEAAREAFVSENFYAGVEKEIFDTAKHGLRYIEFCTPLLPNEKLVSLINDSKKKVRDWLVEKQQYKDYAHIFDAFIEINELKENRDANNVQTSTLSKLKMWKRRSGGDNILTDAEYINMISDKQMNIEFFKTPEQKDKLVDRLIRIIDVNKTLTKVECTKILGPLIELYRVPFRIDEVRALFVKLNDIFDARFELNMYDLLTPTLPGLRSATNVHAFNTFKESLEKDGIVKPSPTTTFGKVANG